MTIEDCYRDETRVYKHRQAISESTVLNKPSEVIKMFRLTLLISAIFVAVRQRRFKFKAFKLHSSLWFQSVLSGFGGPDGSPDGGPNGGEGKHKHHKKMMQCMKQTIDLQESCCPFPRDDSVKDDPVCKEHLEGIEEKEGKEKHRAMKCWFDCIYKSKGLIEEKKLQKDATLNYFDEMLTKLEAEDFKAVTEESIEYCFAESEFSPESVNS